MDAQYSDPEAFLAGDEHEDGPLIAVSGSMSFPGMDDIARKMTFDFAKVAFDAIRDAGGRPRLSDAAAERLTTVDEFFDRADGVLVLGGGDVDRSCYGHTGPTPANEYGVDKRADVHTIELIQEAVRRDMPVLALCRGSQLLNVSFGGTLIPDIENWEIHRGTGGVDLFIDEEVLLEEGSEIRRILGDLDRVTVRNGHHQAVDQVGEALQVAARAHDGIVEGTQHKTAEWVLGLQWHPEEPNANVEHRKLIFEELVSRAKQYREATAQQLA